MDPEEQFRDPTLSLFYDIATLFTSIYTSEYNLESLVVENDAPDKILVDLEAANEDLCHFLTAGGRFGSQVYSPLWASSSAVLVSTSSIKEK